MRPGFGPAAELPTASPVRWRHGGCTSPLGSSNVIGGNRRAAQASARETGRAASTKVNLGKGEDDDVVKSIIRNLLIESPTGPKPVQQRVVPGWKRVLRAEG
jgi:hypothetical protein